MSFPKYSKSVFKVFFAENWSRASTLSASMYVTAPCHPWHRGISASMYVTAPCHPWHRGISASMHVIP